MFYSVTVAAKTLYSVLLSYQTYLVIIGYEGRRGLLVATKSTHVSCFRVSGEVARRRLRHSVLLFFMTPARLWREMGRRLGRHVDKANNGYGGEGPRGCW